MAGIILLLALCVVPAGVVVALIVKEARARYPHRRRASAFAQYHPAPYEEPVAAYNLAATNRRASARTSVAMPDARTPSAVNYIAPADFIRAAFDFTIKQHPAARRRRVTDQGGFAQVPILIHDLHGTSFLTHRKICLN